MNIWTNLAHPREWHVAQTELESEFFVFCFSYKGTGREKHL